MGPSRAWKDSRSKYTIHHASTWRPGSASRAAIARAVLDGTNQLKTKSSSAGRSCNLRSTSLSSPCAQSNSIFSIRCLRAHKLKIPTSVILRMLDFISASKGCQRENLEYACKMSLCDYDYGYNLEACVRCYPGRPDGITRTRTALNISLILL
jgi:hypothetical protein